jgi:hypothetical protein
MSLKVKSDILERLIKHKVLAKPSFWEPKFKHDKF